MVADSFYEKDFPLPDRKENLTRDMILAGHPPLDACLKHRVF